MQQYANLGGDSNVVAYENGADYITVQFASGKSTFYKYTHSSAGAGVVSHMQQLATSGQGLNSYISTEKPDYESKW
ncbi:hypothetical protein GF357_03415 [Candidatus Dojkabacteria bacterium]|nr:hypothetical protein [Candidatus Dojkabacteria bacterium]